MKAKRSYINIFVVFFLFMYFLPSSLLATYNSSKEKITSFEADTGNMNEENASYRKFSGKFTITTQSNNVNDYKVDGVVKNINVAAYVDWNGNGTYSQISLSSSYFTPVSNGNVVKSKEFTFSVSNPNTWARPTMKVVVVARFNGTPENISPSSSTSYRGDYCSKNVTTPPPLSGVSLGEGDVYYEELKSFNGSLGSVNPLTGNVWIHMTTVVNIKQDPFGGAYPSAEAVSVFANLNGGTEPTDVLYEGIEYAPSYYTSIGCPGYPFDIVYEGDWEAGPDVPGVIVGGPALAYGEPPQLGQDCTWGSQMRAIWYLPPKRIEFTPDNVATITQEANSEKMIFTIYDGEYFGASATVFLRDMQIPSRVGGFEWNWGDGSVDKQDMTNGKLTSHRKHQYNLTGSDAVTGRTFSGYCNVKYQNSTSNSTELHYDFDIIVKPLPKIVLKDSIEVYRVGGNIIKQEATYDPDSYYHGYGDTIKEDIEYSFDAVDNGNNNSLTTTEDDRYNYRYYWIITDPAARPTETSRIWVASYSATPEEKKYSYPEPIYHKFKYASQGSEYEFKTVRLYIRYKAGQMENGKLKDLGWKEKLVATRLFNLDAQSILQSKNYQRIAFNVTPASITYKIDKAGDYYNYLCASGTITPKVQTVTMKFNASSTIFYGGRFENIENDLNNSTDSDLDRWNGVATGSVYYRWRVLTADGEDAIAKGYVGIATDQYDLVRDFINQPYPLKDKNNVPLYLCKNIDNDKGVLRKSISVNPKMPDEERMKIYEQESGIYREANEEEFPTGIKPITITFRVPYGTTINPNRFYKVFLEAKYKDIKWGVSHSFGGWKDESQNYKSISGIWRFQNPTTSPRIMARSNGYIFKKQGDSLVIDQSATDKLRNDIKTSSYGASDDNDYVFYDGVKTLYNYNPSKEGSDALYDYSLGYLVKINDQIPARVELCPIEALNPIANDSSYEAYTGDPLKGQPTDYAIKVKVTDNNPDLIASYVEIIYDRFNDKDFNIEERTSFVSDALITDTKKQYASCSNGNFTITTFSSDNIAKNIFDTKISKLKQDEIDEIPDAVKKVNYPFVVSSLKKYNIDNCFVAFYSNDYERLPENYATTTNIKLLKYHGDKVKSLKKEVTNKEFDIATGTLPYRTRVYLDDGIKHYIDTYKLSNSKIASLSGILDNDIPNVKVTLVNPETGNSYVIELLEGFNDPQIVNKKTIEGKTNLLAPLYKKITIGTGTPKISEVIEKFDDDGKLIIDIGSKFVVTANQRFVCNVEVSDNIFNITNDIYGSAYGQCSKITIKASTDKDTEEGKNNTYNDLHPRFRLLPSFKNMKGEYVYNRAGSNNPIEFYLTTVGDTKLTVEVIDETQMNKRIIEFSIPITVNEQGDATVRVLDQRHEKE